MSRPHALWKSLTNALLTVDPSLRPHTVMDVAATFDHTLLHELMYTKTGGDLDDIGTFWLYKPYGWKNCVEKKGWEA